MKKLLFLLIYVIIAQVSFGQENDNTPKDKNEIGFHAGLTTGLGISYRYWFGRAGVQVTTLPLVSAKATKFSGGVSLLYTFREWEYTRFYGYVGSHYLNVNYKEDGKSGDYDQFNMGFGPALAIGHKLRFNIQAGYGIYNLTGNTTTALPTAEIGVYYNF